MKKFLIRLFFCYLIQKAVAWRPFTFHFDEVECERKSNITSFVNCSITHNQRRARSLSFSGRLDKPLTALRLDLTVINSRRQMSDFVLVNVTDFDGCQFLASKASFSILQILRKEFSKYSNMPKACPVRKGYEFHVNHFMLNPDNFPPYIPDTKFTVYVKLRDEHTDIVTMLIRGGVEPKKNG